MKKLLLFAASLLSISQINSQELYNRAYHDVNEKPNSFIIKIYNDLYFTSRNIDPIAKNYLYKHNSFGNLVYRKSVNTGFITNLGFKSSDNKLILVGNEFLCDVVGPTWHISLTKLDTNGTTVLFSTSVTATFYDYPKAALQKLDSSYAVFTDSLLYKFSKTGQFLSKVNIGLTNISSALILANNNILLSGDQGNSHVIAEISGSGSIVSSNITSVLMRQISFYGGQKIIGVGTDGVFYKYSTTGNLIASSSFTGGLLASNFICEQDTLYSLSSMPILGQSYFAADTSFNVISLTSTTTHSLEQTAICANGTKVAILSAGVSSNNLWSTSYSHYFSSLSSINKFSSNNFSSDLTLVSVTADSAYSSCYFSIFPAPGEYHCASYLRVKVMVKNKGTTEIKNFKLNCFDSPAITCGAFFYQEQFSGLSLMPGDSIQLTGNLFARKGYAYTGNAPSFTNNFCFYISVPNGETDKTVEDNEQCSTVNFLVTSLKQNSLNEMAVKIWPNPFTNNLKIESDVLIKEVKIMNSLGMLVKSVEAKNAKIALDNSDLASGVYFINIETEKGNIIKKIIKH
ncbi:T9SS type A sorting domain-containing protein [Aurantibacillus circumpalustris]|uniref:T9SS type A sorting domain-containing protein n=1 Tax=Aurantibacillus circumpalustris TaxID=3036359 RepID=UPI00295BBE71|nr:T9SS type A sorting domain-containing protein [Aurantibacillus circumpalustris]